MSRNRAWWEWVVRFAVGEPYAEEILGDLAEGFASVAAVEDERVARRWRRRQVAAFVWIAIRRRGAAAGKWLWSVARPEILFADARVAFRGFRARPGFTAACLLTFAVGIGGSTAVFAVIDGVLLRPLPYPEPDQLVAIRLTYQEDSWWSAGATDVLTWRQAGSLADVGWSRPRSVRLGGEGLAVQVDATAVSSSFFRVLGVEPLRGRSFEPGDDQEGGPPVAMLSASAWRSRFGGEPILGSVLIIDGEPHDVVGILPPHTTAFLNGSPEIFLPLRFSVQEQVAGARTLRQTIGRLAPGVGPDTAEEELVRLQDEVDGVAGSQGGRFRATVTPLADEILGDVRLPLLVLFGATICVLLVACLNVGNLLLARGASRRTEFAVRTTLGASRARLAVQVLVEAALLASVGGLVGFVGAIWGARALVAISPDSLPRSAELGWRWEVVLPGVTIVVLATLLAGLPAALRHAGARARELRKTGAGLAPAEARFASALVALEVAFVLMLLVAAGLMTTSFAELRAEDTGFDPEDVVVFRVSMPGGDAMSSLLQSRWLDGLIERVEGVAVVERAGATTMLPFVGAGWTVFHLVESQPMPEPGEEPTGRVEFVSPGYFPAMGIDVLQGRALRPGDGGQERVTVVDTTMLRHHWTDREPLGDRIRFSPGGPWYRVVGVVSAVRYGPGVALEPRAYLPMEEMRFGSRGNWWLTVRTSPDSGEAVMGSVPRVLEQYDSDAALGRVATMGAIASEALARARMQTFLLGAFGMVALLLGVTGVHGMVSHGVGQRLREIGLRMALGAEPRRLILRFVGRALVPVAFGSLLGLAGALALGRLFADLLYRVDPADPRILGVVWLVLLLAAAVAALVPVVRAARIDPAGTLRRC